MFLVIEMKKTKEHGNDFSVELSSINQRALATFRLPLIAGILILTNAILLGVVSTWFPWVMPTIPGTTNEAVPFVGLTALGLICGSLVLLGGLFLRNQPMNRRAGGIIVMAFSIPTVIMGGGFIIGFILGIIGGAKVFREKS